LEDIEIVCINDGSKDATLNIMQDYAKRDKRIKIIDKPNSGYGNSMNVGIEATKGEYIGILEPDDYVQLDMFEILYGYASSHKLDFVKSNFNIFAEDIHGISYQLNMIAQRERNYEQVVNPSQEPENLGHLMHTWCGIYKRSFLNQNKIRYHETPGAGFQDNSFFFQTYTQAQRAMFIDHTLYNLRRDNPNSSVNNPGNMLIMDNEMEWCEKKIKSIPNKWDLFKFEFARKSYFNKVFNLQRLSPELQKEYVTILSKWVQLQFNSELFDPILFNSEVWSQLTLLAENPSMFLTNFANAKRDHQEISESSNRLKFTLPYISKFGFHLAMRTFRKTLRKITGRSNRQ
jgi:glycosyltransferase involved in cell wall biosynthesis